MQNYCNNSNQVLTEQLTGINIFPGVNGVFVLSFENNTVKIGQTRYCLPTIDIKNHTVTFMDKTFLISY